MTKTDLLKKQWAALVAGVKRFPLAILFFVLLGLAVKQISYHPLFSAPQLKQLFENLLCYYLPFRGAAGCRTETVG